MKRATLWSIVILSLVGLSAHAEESGISIELKNGNQVEAHKMSLEDGTLKIQRKGVTIPVPIEHVSSFNVDFSVVRQLRKDTEAAKENSENTDVLKRELDKSLAEIETLKKSLKETNVVLNEIKKKYDDTKKELQSVNDNKIKIERDVLSLKSSVAKEKRISSRYKSEAVSAYRNSRISESVSVESNLPTENGWRILKSWNGKGAFTTDKIQIPSGSRLRWVVNVDSRDMGGVFQIYSYLDNSEIPGIVANVNGNDKGSSHIHTAGMYYFQFNAALVSFNVVLETKTHSQESVSEQAESGVGVQWKEIDRIYNLRSSFTDLQKDEYWKKYKGKEVQWSGRVSAISETFGKLSIQIKMNPDTFTSDVFVGLSEDERDKALKLSEGDMVTFTGILDRWGSLMPTTLKNGKIVQ